MKKIPLTLGPGYKVLAEVCESMGERKRGLQGHAPLGEDECMAFPFAHRRASAHFHMGTVSFPIDIVWVREGSILKIVTGNPGDTESWTAGGVDAVIELRGGWCASKGLGVGDHLVDLPPELGRTAQATNNLLRTLTEADKDAPEDGIIADGVYFPSKAAQFISNYIMSLPTLTAASAMDRLLGRNAHPDYIARRWSILTANMNLSERDGIVRALHEVHGDKALSLLSAGRTAQTNSELPITTRREPGAKPPRPDTQVGQIPADMPGTGTDNPIPLVQSFGYDPLLEDIGMGTRPAAIDSPEHYEVRCANCDGVVEQCRCRSPNKRVDYVASCPECGKKAAQRVTAAGEIHEGDRVKTTEDADGQSKDDKGTVLEIQGDAIQVKFDGEPIPRWMSRKLLTVDRAKEDALKDLEEDTPGPAAPDAGGDDGADGGDDGGLSSLLQALGGLANSRGTMPGCSPSP